MGDEESSEDSGDEYVQERHAPKGKARVKRRSKGDARGGGGERRQTQRKRKRKQQLEDMTDCYDLASTFLQQDIGGRTNNGTRRVLYAVP